LGSQFYVSYTICYPFGIPGTVLIRAWV